MIHRTVHERFGSPGQALLKNDCVLFAKPFLFASHAMLLDSYRRWRGGSFDADVMGLDCLVPCSCRIVIDSVRCLITSLSLLRQLRSEDVVRAYIERIREVNPLINAVVEERFEAAIEEARKADALIAETQPLWLIKNYPLLGVPCTVKESCSLRGAPLTGGSLARKGLRATTDGEAVAHIRAAGCIPLLVSNTPEYCLNWESYNHITGRTLNPYDNRRTAGGSSGGEGALIGSGASLFGVGSDVAGSIRVPAHCNGIFGHKPTAGE